MAALTQLDHSFTTTAPERAGQVRFCTRCGEPNERPAQAVASTAPRVCQLCGMGILLTCASEALPGAGAAFMVVTADLRITALSEAAEGLFGSERSLVSTPLLGLLASPMGEDRLARTVARAALRSREPEVMPMRSVREASADVGMLAGRISTCGPPRGALITVEPSGFGLR